MWCLCLFGVVSGVFLGVANFPEFLGVFVGRGRPGPGGADRLWGGAGEGDKGRVAGCGALFELFWAREHTSVHAGAHRYAGAHRCAHRCAQVCVRGILDRYVLERAWV